MVLDRVQFDNMQVLDQIEYINNKLTEGYALTRICEVIGIGRTIETDRFLEDGR